MDCDLDDSLEELSRKISSNVSTVCDYLRENNQPQPSFNADGPEFFPSAPENIAKARDDLISSALMLHYLALWPAGAIDWYSNSGYLDISSIGWLCHFQVPQAVPLHGNITFSDLALKCGVDEKALKSVLRHAITNGWFHELQPDKISHSAMSKLIVTNEAMHAQIAYRAKVTFLSATKLIEATEKFGQNPTSSNAAFNVAHQTELPNMVWSAQNPDTAPLFAGMMRAYHASSSHGITRLINGYEWQSFGAGLLVDVRYFLSEDVLTELSPYSNSHQ